MDSARVYPVPMYSHVTGRAVSEHKQASTQLLETNMYHPFCPKLTSRTHSRNAIRVVCSRSVCMVHLARCGGNDMWVGITSHVPHVIGTTKAVSIYQSVYGILSGTFQYRKATVATPATCQRFRSLYPVRRDFIFGVDRLGSCEK